MLDFDCLIRPDSNYSICASILGDFKVVVSPLHIQWKNNLPYIDKARFSIRTEAPN